MGVRGLSRFVEESNFSTDFALHDTSVVIDGCSLLHCLYAYSGASYMYGGDYDVYAAYVKKYFSCLEECNIKSIVIFDGGYNKSDRMFKKLLERQKHRLENIKKVIDNNDSTPEVLPINAYEVFKNILSEMHILYAQCDYEGDNQMASLALQYNCPILSEDSDFYIYDLPNGFIRLNLIDKEVKTKISRDGSTGKYLSCKIYYLKTLLSVYQPRDRNVLPLLATLAGNDYASPYEEFQQFYSRLKITSREKFHRVFGWLRNKTLNEAKNEVLNLIEWEKREEVRSIIENSLEDYKIKPTNMVNILSYLSSGQYDALIQETKLISACGELLPPNFVIAFHRGQLPSTLLNVMTLHRSILSPQFDDFCNYDSSYTCSRYIRQVIYGILLQHDSNSERHLQACLRTIKEYDRVGKTVQGIPVKFLSNLQNGDPVVSLSDIHTKQTDQLRDFIERVMEAKRELVSDVTSNLQLFFICVNYWLLKSYPKPSRECLPALILCIVYFEAKDILFQESENAELLSYSAANFVFKNLGKYLQKQSYSYELFDTRIVHSFNQLQACVLACVSMNLLINVPFEPPKLHKFFNGSLLYNLTKELQLNPINKSSFIRQLLGEEAFKIFNMLGRKFIDINPSEPMYTAMDEFFSKMNI